jgi:hypothetical protein
MADNHNIIAFRVQLAPSLVCYGRFLEFCAAFQGERWDHIDLLIDVGNRRHSKREGPILIRKDGNSKATAKATSNGIAYTPLPIGA